MRIRHEHMRFRPKLSLLRECRVFVCKRESVHAPSFRIRINLRRFDKSAADLEPLASANADHIVRNARFCGSAATLLVYRCVPIARDLAVLETVVAKFFGQWFIELAFFSPSLSRNARFFNGESRGLASDP